MLKLDLEEKGIHKKIMPLTGISIASIKRIVTAGNKNSIRSPKKKRNSSNKIVPTVEDIFIIRCAIIELYKTRVW